MDGGLAATHEMRVVTAFAVAVTAAVSAAPTAAVTAASNIQMKPLRILAITTTLVCITAAIAAAHDLFLKPSDFFAAANSQVLVRVLNGTFSKSENSIARTRLADVSIVTTSDGRFRVDTSQWGVSGDTSTLTVNTGAAGTYLIGASTKPSIIALKAKDFNAYLTEDGIPDVLAARRKSKELTKDARERYAKHVKALIQVGGARTDAYGAQLGYPAEIIPLENPYTLRRGTSLSVRALVDGQPVPNQLVQFGGRTATDGRIEQRSVRTDSAGVARIPLRQAGSWYVKFIRMSRVQGDSVDYESKWATLTFAVR